MPQLIMSRREFAGIPVVMTTAAIDETETVQPRRVVALGWISRTGGQVTISDRLTDSSSVASRTVAP